jgi:nucleotide-binding universal stress UspA family protein
MSKPILVGLDPQREDIAPLRLGAALARVTGAPLMVLGAWLHDPLTQAVPTGLVEHDLRTDALEKLEALTAGTDADLLVLGGPSPAHALHRAVVRLDASMIVVGSTAKGPLGRVAPGSTAERLLHGAPCPVAVAPSGLGGDWEPRRVGAAFIDFEDGHAALRVAALLAQASDGTLRAVTVIEPIELRQSAAIAPYRTDGRLDTPKATVQRALDDAIQRLPVEVATTTEILVGPVADVLTELSDRVDVLVCGSRGYGPVRSVLLGGVTHRLIRQARCPVVVVPRASEQAVDHLAEIVTTSAR